jgi:hypothetical protein
MRDWSSLTARGYALTELGDVPVWHRFDDDAIAYELSDDARYADPFHAEMMRAARFAVLGDLVIGTANWPDLRETLSASLAADNEADATHSSLAVLVEAMTDAAQQAPNAGPVIQAVAVPLQSMVRVPNGPADQAFRQLVESSGAENLLDVVPESEAGSAPDDPRLPIYPLALIVDMQAGGDQLATIALPFAERAAAQRATSVLTERLRGWEPTPQMGLFLPALGGSVESAVVDAPGLVQALAEAFAAQLGVEAEEVGAVGDDPNAGAIAVVSVRYGMPEPGPDTAYPGWGFRIFWGGLMNGALSPLSPR